MPPGNPQSQHAYLKRITTKEAFKSLKTRLPDLSNCNPTTRRMQFRFGEAGGLSAEMQIK